MAIQKVASDHTGLYIELLGAAFLHSKPAVFSPELLNAPKC